MSYAHKCSHHYCCGTVEVNPLGNNVKADCTEAESNAVRPSGLLGQIAIISPTDAHEQSVSASPHSLRRNAPL